MEKHFEQPAADALRILNFFIRPVRQGIRKRLLEERASNGSRAVEFIRKLRVHQRLLMRAVVSYSQRIEELLQVLRIIELLGPTLLFSKIHQEPSPRMGRGGMAANRLSDSQCTF